VDTDSYIACIKGDTAAMITAVGIAGLEASVPTCPGWTVLDLVTHTGVVHRHKTETVRGGYLDQPPPQPGGPDRDVLRWFCDGVEEMLVVFAEADLSAPTWTWCAHEHNADWWVRRMAHETAIHAADAVITSKGIPVVGTALAIDGVDEILDEMMVDGPSWGTVTPTDRVVALESADRRWVLRTAKFGGTSPVTGTAYEGLDTFVYDRTGAAEATVRADPETLDLWLWGRRKLPVGAVRGDPSLVDHVRAVAAESTA
jgi:uncharacterized protein (TIGR03083 family)